MKDDKVFLHFRRVISQNLNHSYNKNTAKVRFNLASKIQQNDDKFKYQNTNFTLLTGYFSGIVKLSEWRLPQTLIYYTKIETLFFRLDIVKYFDFSYLMIENKSKSDKLEITLSEIAGPLNIKNLKTGDFHSENFIETDCKATNLFFVYSVDITPPDNINTYFNTLIKSERDNHPISKIISFDIDFLTRIDILWSQIPGNRGSFKEIKPPDNTINLWAFYLLYYELCEILGWREQQKQLIKNITDISISEFFLNQKKAFPQKLNQENQTFREIYFTPDDFSASSKELIQKTWNRISLPSQQMFVKKLIIENPEEIICFLLLAIKYQFWWSGKALERIIKVSEIDNSRIQPLFELVFLLRQRFYFFRTNSGIKIAATHANIENYIDILKNNDVILKLVKKKSLYVTSLLTENSVLFTINKRVVCEYKPAEFSFNIDPFIYQYENPEWNYCTIKAQSNIYKIAMAWPDFTLHLGVIRLKFLFKKDKYQLSIKGIKGHNDIFIDGKQISFQESLYHKFFVSAAKSEKTFSDHYYSSGGSSIMLYKIPFGLKNIRIHALGTNQFRQIIQYINLQKNKSKSSTRMPSLNNPPEQFDCSNPYKIIVPKTAHFEKNAIVDNRLLNKLLQTEADILEHQLVLWIDTNRENPGTEEISEMFFSAFAFYPYIHSLNNLDTALYKYNILIANKVLGKNRVEGENCFEIDLKTGGNKKLIVVSPEKFSHWIQSILA